MQPVSIWAIGDIFIRTMMIDDAGPVKTHSSGLERLRRDQTGSKTTESQKATLGAASSKPKLR